MNKFLSTQEKKEDKCSTTASPKETLEIVKKGTKIEIIPAPRGKARHSSDKNLPQMSKPMRLSISSEMSAEKPQTQQVKFISALNKHSESECSEEPSLIRQVSTLSLLDLSSENYQHSTRETYTRSILNSSFHLQQVYCKHCKKDVFISVRYKQPRVSFWNKVFCNYCFYHKQSFIAFYTCRNCGVTLNKPSSGK